VKVYYDWIDKDLDCNNIEEHIQLLRKDSPKWWNSLKAFQNGAKSVKDFLSNLNWEDFAYGDMITTVKVCPGFNQHFNNSLLMRFPCDIMLETNEDGRFRYKTSNKSISISGHHEDQAPEFLQKNNLIVLKFDAKYVLKTSKQSQLSFVDPILYKDQPYRASPGCAYINNKAVPPNFICFFPKISERYFFKAGDPMAVLQFSDKVTAIEKKDFTKDIKHFLVGHKSFFAHTKK
jgi:hypothetical protein